MKDLELSKNDGTRTKVPASAIEDLKRRFRGELSVPGDAGYDAARRVWNALVDRRPGLIASCTSADDVAEIVRLASPLGLTVSIRGGGHNIWGTAICEGGVVIDLSKMKAIDVQPAARRAVVQPGVRWQELDRETQAHGLATPGGQHSEVGVAGFTLGGGIGWLARKHGLAVDNLKSAEVVTADGKRLKASAKENADLFWGLRGGGGNFGVVTSFEFELHPVGPTVLAGMVVHPLPRAREALHFFRDFSQKCSDELHVIAVMMTAPDGNKGVALFAFYDGPPETGQEAVKPLREFGPPVMDQLGPIPYVVLQSMMDGLAPAGRFYFNRSRYMKSLSDAALETAIERFAAAPSPFCTVFLHRLGGAIARVAPEATAYGHRNAEYILVAEASWAEPAAAEAHERWTRGLQEAMEPFTIGAAYVNDLGREEDEGGAGLRAAFGSNYDRLVSLKKKYDPTNFFRHNQNIKP